MSKKDYSECATTLRSGDILLMDRQCFQARDPMGIALCLLNKTESKYDHVAMVLKLDTQRLQQFCDDGIINVRDSTSPSGTYVVETNMNGITLRSFEKRLGQSSANSFAVRRLEQDADNNESEKRLIENTKEMYKFPYKRNLAGFIPSFLSPPDKIDRVNAAHKYHILMNEIEKIDELLSSQNTSNRENLRYVRHLYVDAIHFISDVYFPHLERQNNVGELPLLEWFHGHFAVDGSNTEMALICSELIIRLWQRSGLVTGFPPASSFRPFDFLDDQRFNFLSCNTLLHSVFQITENTTNEALEVQKFNTSIRGTHEKSVERRLHFFANTCGINWHEENVLDAFVTDKSRHAEMLLSWLIQSSPSSDVRRDIVFNVFSVGVLFAMCGLIYAPLRLRLLERQLGVMLIRGSIWSLSVGLFTRDMLCIFVQCLTFSTINYFIHSDSVVMGKRLVQTNLFDSRHPYYYVCGSWFASNAVSHFCTTPVVNLVLAHHFGPSRPSSPPFRAIMRGAISLAPVGVLLPYQATWISWYETAGSAIIPTPSSLLRRRTELLGSEEWNHFRLEALTGAFAATMAMDFFTYPLRTICWRKFLSHLHRPATSPVYGRRLYAGYLSCATYNILAMSTTAVSCFLMGIL